MRNAFVVRVRVISAFPVNSRDLHETRMKNELNQDMK